MAQERRDARRPVDEQGRHVATPGERARHDSVTDRSVFGGEQTRRLHQRAIKVALKDVAPDKASKAIAGLRVRG